MRRVLAAFALLIVTAAVAAGVAVLWFGKRAEPPYDGSIVVDGLKAPVLVRFGPHAVPTVEAQSVGDMLFAQGYLVASERMWQMDLMRRLAGGRLAEVFGERALPLDRYYRTIGLPRAAREAHGKLEPRFRRMLGRYADGVNAYRDAAAERLPLEYLIAGFSPAPWQPEDSLVIGEYMAWINSVNLREELTFLRIASRLGTRRALELFPADQGIPAPADAADLPEYRGLLLADLSERGSGSAPSLQGLLALSRPSAGAASNVWAVTGPRSADGNALLANDPHLVAGMPGTWYELEMRAPGYHAAGLALPGVPLLVLGHNADLAWGLTSAVPDTQDLFLERLIDAGDAVLRPSGGSEPIRERIELIPVQGRAEPVALTIRSTEHGVLIDELLRPDQVNPDALPRMRLPDALAFRRSMEVPDRALVALWRLNTARTVADARAAGGDLRRVSQNLVIAHRKGDLGWQVTGALPVRGRGSGAFPVPGWEPGYGWTGYLPFERNPGVTNPPDHLLVTANNRNVPEDWPDRIGHAWLPPYRAQRIRAMLDAEGQPDAPRMAAMQADRRSERAAMLNRSLLGVLPDLRRVDPDAAAIAERELLGWDLTFDPDSRPAAFYGLLIPALYRALFGDELGSDLTALMALDFISYGPLDEALRTGRSSFWDDIATPGAAEGPAEIWARALHDTAAALAHALPDPDDRRLARLRSLTFPHAFDGQPLLGRLFNVGPIGVGGDPSTVDVAGVSPLRPREVDYIPSVRVVYTPADWARTRGSLPLGQSGHRFSRYRTDQLADWLAVDGHRWAWNGPAGGALIGELTLLPAEPGATAAAP